jgi:hypothetical protein
MILQGARTLAYVFTSAPPTTLHDPDLMMLINYTDADLDDALDGVGTGARLLVIESQDIDKRSKLLEA